QRLYVASFDTEGTASWAHDFGNGLDGTIVPGDVAADPVDGRVLVIGQFSDTVELDMSYTSEGDTDVFLLDLSQGGGTTWAKTAGDGDEQLGRGIAPASSGDRIAVGDFRSSIVFGASTLNSAGLHDGFGSRVKDMGAEWSKRWGNDAEQGAWRVVST